MGVHILCEFASVYRYANQFRDRENAWDWHMTDYMWLLYIFIGILSNTKWTLVVNKTMTYSQWNSAISSQIYSANALLSLFLLLQFLMCRSCNDCYVVWLLCSIPCILCTKNIEFASDDNKNRRFQSHFEIGHSTSVHLVSVNSKFSYLFFEVEEKVWVVSIC